MARRLVDDGSAAVPARFTDMAAAEARVGNSVHVRPTAVAYPKQRPRDPLILQRAE